MSTNVKQVEEQFQVKRYKIQYPISAYTFPREIQIHQVRFDDKYMSVELTDGRVLSIPLEWVPTVRNASAEERGKYEISRDRTMIIWDPDKCAINDEIRVADYMGPNAGVDRAAEGTRERRPTTRAPRQRRARRL